MWFPGPPGVYRPQGDTFLLAEVLRRVGLRTGARVLDLCAGSGALGLTAAHGGAADVTAVDIDAGAVLAARVNARLCGARMRVLHGDLFAPVSGEVFDVVVTNPPYLPAEAERPPRRGPARAWDAGRHGRALIDRICEWAPRALARGGMLLMVHSALSGIPATIESLRAGGLRTSVIARRSQPFGPVLRTRAGLLEERGLIPHGRREEELVVIRADRT